MSPGSKRLADSASAVFLPDSGEIQGGGTLGDVDGDGFSDFFVELKRGGDTETLGFPGKSSGLIVAADAIFRLDGGNVDLSSAEGDIDGDGWNDLLTREVRGNDEPSKLLLYYGPLMGSRDVASPDFAITGEYDGYEYVQQIAHVGDINGDDRGEIAFSSTSGRNTLERDGAVFLVMGPVVGAAQARDSDVAIRGWNGDNITSPIDFPRIASGDLDGDGRPDLVAADPYHDDLRGRISIFRSDALSR